MDNQLSIILTIAAAAATMLLPRWAALLWVLPTAYVSTTQGATAPLFLVGAARIGAQDLVLAIIVFKTLLAWKRTPHSETAHKVYMATLAYLGVAAGCTLIAFWRFGAEVFLTEANALARLTAQLVVLPLFYHAVRRPEDLAKACASLRWVGMAMALNVFCGAVLSRFGIAFGEYIETEYGTRAFGVLGDSVGFMLVLFLLLELAHARYVRVGILGTAILVTGTIGAITTLLVALMAFASARKMNLRQRRTIWLGILLVSLLIGTAAYANLGMVRGRSYDSTAAQRFTSMSFGLEFFKDDPATGAGYCGYAALAERDGVRARFLESIGAYARNYSANSSNQWVQVLADGGIVGLAAFVFLVGTYLQVLKRLANAGDWQVRTIGIAGYCWLFGLIIGNQSAVWLLPASLVGYWMWIVAGLAIVCAEAMVQSRIIVQIVPWTSDGATRCPAPPLPCSPEVAG